jgi:cytochrome P450
MVNVETPLVDWPLQRTCPFAPPPELERLRGSAPQQVRHRDGIAWVITRFEDVHKALSDPRLSADDQQPNFPRRIQLPPVPRIQSFWRMDEPEHSRLRRMLTPEFTARATRANRPRVEQLVEELLDDVVSRPRPVDLVSTFTLKLPAMVIARMFGVPDEDLMSFVEQSQLILAQDAGPEVPIMAYQAMTAYLERLAAQRAREPREDLISRLATEYGAKGELTGEDLVAMARLMLIAGHETTANQIALSVVALLHNPDQLAALRADPALMPGFVEETMRFWSIAQDNIVRVAAADLEIGGTRIAKGDGVILSIPGANHDPAVYPDPERFDIRREARQNVAFGSGSHFCPGAPLARLEVEIGIGRLFERFPNLQLAEDEIPFRDRTLVYGVQRLLVTW